MLISKALKNRHISPYMADGRKLVEIGISFDSEERNLGEWIID